MGEIKKVNQGNVNKVNDPVDTNKKDSEKEAAALHQLSGKIDETSEQAKKNEDAKKNSSNKSKKADPSKPDNPNKPDPKKPDGPKKPVAPPPPPAAGSSTAAEQVKKRQEEIERLNTYREQTLGQLADLQEQMLSESNLNEKQKNNARMASSDETHENIKNNSSSQYDAANPMVFVPTYAAGVMKMLMKTFIELIEAQIQKMKTQGDLMIQETKQGGLIDQTAQSTIEGANLQASSTRTQAWSSLAASLVGVAGAVTGAAVQGMQQKNLDTSEEDTYNGAIDKINEPPQISVEDDIVGGQLPDGESPDSLKAQWEQAKQYVIDNPETALGLGHADIESENGLNSFGGTISKKGKVTQFAKRVEPYENQENVSEHEFKIPGLDHPLGKDSNKFTLSEILSRTDEDGRATVKETFAYKSKQAGRDLESKRDKIKSINNIVTQAFEPVKGMIQSVSGETQAQSQAAKGTQDANAQRFQQLVKLFDNISSQLQSAEKAQSSGADASKQVLQAIIQSAARN